MQLKQFKYFPEWICLTYSVKKEGGHSHDMDMTF